MRKCPAERALHVKRVRPDTVVKYAGRVNEFLVWAESLKFRVKSVRKADRAMATYFDQLFEDGCALTIASYTLFGYIVLRICELFQTNLKETCSR